jgi:dolichol-phosphate mannosyltransferase
MTLDSVHPMPRVSIVVPTFNESENITTLVNAVHGVLGEIPHEILVVDDDSPDQTWMKVSDMAQSRPWLRSIRRVGKRGLSSAVLDGFAEARGSYLGVMDADLSHDERILPELVAALDKGADLAIGSRRVPGGGAVEWPWYRRMTSSGATLLAKLVLNLNISDPMSGYFVTKRAIYERSKERLEPRGYKILVEIAVKGRPERIKEVPFIFRNRKEGYSKLSGSVMAQYIQMLLMLRFGKKA